MIVNLGASDARLLAEVRGPIEHLTSLANANESALDFESASRDTLEKAAGEFEASVAECQVKRLAYAKSRRRRRSARIRLQSLVANTVGRLNKSSESRPASNKIELITLTTSDEELVDLSSQYASAELLASHLMRTLAGKRSKRAMRTSASLIGSIVGIIGSVLMIGYFANAILDDAASGLPRQVGVMNDRISDLRKIVATQNSGRSIDSRDIKHNIKTQIDDLVVGPFSSVEVGPYAQQLRREFVGLFGNSLSSATDEIAKSALEQLDVIIASLLMGNHPFVRDLQRRIDEAHALPPEYLKQPGTGTRLGETIGFQGTDGPEEKDPLERLLDGAHLESSLNPKISADLKMLAESLRAFRLIVTQAITTIDRAEALLKATVRGEVEGVSLVLSDTAKNLEIVTADASTRYSELVKRFVVAACVIGFLLFSIRFLISIYRKEHAAFERVELDEITTQKLLVAMRLNPELAPDLIRRFVTSESSESKDEGTAFELTANDVESIREANTLLDKIFKKA